MNYAGVIIHIPYMKLVGLITGMYELPVYVNLFYMGF